MKLSILFFIVAFFLNPIHFINAVEQDPNNNNCSIQQITGKRKGKAPNPLIQGVGQVAGHPSYRCVRCSIFEGYYYQVVEHLHNECFPSNDLFSLDKNGHCVIPKYRKLKQDNITKYGQDAIWPCVFCNAEVNSRNYKNHLQFNTKPTMALDFFDGCNEPINIGRNKAELSEIKKRKIDEPVEALLLLKYNRNK